MAILEANKSNLEKAAQLLGQGECVAMPTETVYGLAADGLCARATAKIFAIKGRPAFNPLILHVARGYDLSQICEIGGAARILMGAFWPGPLTLVLPKKEVVPDLVTAGLNAVAVRCPDHPVAEELLALFGRPLAAPSANRSGRISPTDAKAVEEELGDAVKIILNGGPCRIGLESTVVDAAAEVPLILRQGAISQAALEEALQRPVNLGKSRLIESPGQLESHYAPATPLYRSRAFLHGQACLDQNSAYLFWSKKPNLAPPVCRVLTPQGDAVEAAANLFRFMRELDQSGAKKIVCDPIPLDHPLALAIDDRLRRACSGFVE